MARKNLLQDLMEAPPRPQAAPETKSATGARPGRTGAAIGAVSQTIADLRARAVVDLDPHLISAGGLMDRLEHDEADHAALMDSIATYGQQVPVLVRPHPADEGRYQIVYGRRRVLATRDLGISVKAMVRTLDDRDLVIAQGQENNARRELSFIEKANFARQMVEAGFKRKVICDALAIDKTLISRMLSVAERIAPRVIEAIGPAPGIGRDRWLGLAELIDATETTPNEAAVLAYGASSDARFEALVHALTLPARRAAEAHRAEREDGRTWSGPPPGGARPDTRISRTAGRVVLSLADDGFADWLVDNLDGLRRRWLDGEV